jgi:serine/threonine protein kinase
MKVKCDPSGEVLTLDDGLPLGSGGEGDIYTLPDKPDLAAKIYHAHMMAPERVAKLKAMLANAPADPMRKKHHASIAWPLGLLRSLDGTGRVVGFLMPLVRDVYPMSAVCDVGTRLAEFPLFSYDYLCRTATNLASAVAAIHARGYVIGDVNDSNILVTKKALVTLVDTDSFQVKDPVGGCVYRCPVGTEGFTPPELRGKNFEEVDRSQQHDLFGLAVLFFQLLMEGTQPFACVARTAAELPYPECVARGYFPYGGHPSVDPRPSAPPFEMLHPLLQRLFRQCFVDGHANPARRPDSETWLRALRHSEQALTNCRRNPQHYYFDHSPGCPWCERARKYQPKFMAAGVADWDPFPPPHRVSAGGWSHSSAARPSVGSRPSVPSGRAHGPAPMPAGAPTAPSSFTASATTVSIGQAVTLQWNVPHAQTVRITDQRGRRIFVGNAPSGLVTVYPTRNKTYHLTALGVGGSPPNPLAVTVVPVPMPVKLKQSLLELNQPTQLRAVGVGLRPGLSLNQISTKLSSWLKLRHYSPLGSYTKLRRISVGLRQHSPRPGPKQGHTNPQSGRGHMGSSTNRL